MNVDELIDSFVERINAQAREPKMEEEVPTHLRCGQNAYGWYDWKVKRNDRIGWIAELESKLPCGFPYSFRSLICRYEFPEVEVGPLAIFANTSEGTTHEMREEIFVDRALSRCLLAAGLIQFGRPSDGSYDPVCFDARVNAHRREFPIVRVDHEEILRHHGIRIVEQLAPSFQEFVSGYVSPIPQP